MGLLDWIRGSGGPLEAERAAAASIGHREFPFLSATYSPGSRIPCRDFTKFIVSRIEAADTGSIQRLLRAFVEANPGLGTGGEWVDRAVERELRFDLRPYIQFADPCGYSEYKAMSCIFAKSGVMDRFSHVSDDRPQLLTLALSCWRPEPTHGLIELRNRANRKIRSLAREGLPYWEDYESFKKQDFGDYKPPPDSVMAKLQELPVTARMMLGRVAVKGGGRLEDSTTYHMRSYGLHPPEAAHVLKTAGMVLPAATPEALAATETKDDLRSLAEGVGVQVRKSWSKAKIVKALRTGAPDQIEDLCRKRGVYDLDPEWQEGLQAWAAYCGRLERVFELISFAR